MPRLFWAAALLLLGLPLACAKACDCAGPQHEQSIRSAKIIFAVHVEGEAEPDSLPIFQRRYSVRVLAVWRGDVPESATVYIGAACGYPLEPGREYLIYILREHPAGKLVSLMCTGTGPLDNLYYDRYLLGDPAIRYDSDYETVTLDTMLNGITQPGPGAELLAWQFSHFTIETPLLLPKLRRIARQDVSGNQLAAVKAIRWLGPAAQDAYDDLRLMYESPSGKEPELHLALLEAMLSINRDYSKNRRCLLEGMRDPDARVRKAVALNIRRMQNLDELEVRDVTSIALDDEDPAVRVTAIRLARFEDFSTWMAKRIKKVSRSDNDADVRSEARNYLDLREQYINYSRPFGSVDDRGFAHPKRRH